MGTSGDWFRIGIDVGGTFTHAVAVSGESGEVVGAEKVPTTHRDLRGVAVGIEEVLRQLLQRTSIQPSRVRQIAHCTTQTTNALLEGDLPAVGLLVLTSPGVTEGMMRRSISPSLQTGRGRSSHVAARLFSESSQIEFDRILEEMIAEGAKSFAVTRPFGVEDPAIEEKWAECIRGRGFPAVSAASLTGLYGMKVRTQTALINSALLPTMLQTARQTESALRRVGLPHTMLVMRSDGGVLTLPEVEKRPILTILSGPAAGVAGALFYQKLVRGILVEVGGTSTDISVILDGRPRVRFAEVGGNRLYLRTLDIRTVGVAGGSLPRLHGKQLVDVGPRSAHLAGLPYSCFADRVIRNPRIMSIRPLAGDPEYMAVEDEGGNRYAITPTCAANFLGDLNAQHAAFGDRHRAGEAFQALSRFLDVSPEEAARKILELASRHLEKVITTLLKELRIDRREMWLLGGGGGCAVYVPLLAKKLNLPFQIALYHDVFSAIGAALALLHESEEQSSPTFSVEEVEAVRGRLEKKLAQMGADPDTMEISIEMDRRRGIIRGDGFGSLPQAVADSTSTSRFPEDVSGKIHQQLSQFLLVSPEEVSLVSETPYLLMWRVQKEPGRFFRPGRPERVVVTARDGSIRWTKSHVQIWSCPSGQILSMLQRILDEKSRWGDAGRELPAIHVVIRSRVLEFSGFLSVEEAKQAVSLELQRGGLNDTVFLLV